MTTSPLFDSDHDEARYYDQINRTRELFEFGLDLLLSWSVGPADGVTVVFS